MRSISARVAALEAAQPQDENALVVIVGPDGPTPGEATAMQAAEAEGREVFVIELVGPDRAAPAAEA